MLREDVATLPVCDTVAQVEELLHTMTMQECKVNTMLPPKMAHGVILAAPYDLDRGLVVAKERERNRQQSKVLRRRSFCRVLNKL